MRPPLQPSLPSAVEQSTSCYSERDSRTPDLICHLPSMAPVAEKDQQDPHCPWSLTGVTAPEVRQSTESGKVTFSSLREWTTSWSPPPMRLFLWWFLSWALCLLKPRSFLYSASLKSAIRLRASWWSSVFSELCFRTRLYFLAKIASLKLYSSWVP